MAQAGRPLKRPLQCPGERCWWLAPGGSIGRCEEQSRLTKVANGLEIGCRGKRGVWDNAKLFGLRNWREGETFAEMGNTVAGSDLG